MKNKSLNQQLIKLLMNVNEMVTDTDHRSVCGITTSSRFSGQEMDLMR